MIVPLQYAENSYIAVYMYKFVCNIKIRETLQNTDNSNPQIYS